MTVVVTELSRFGIAMVADSAVTVSGPNPSVHGGATKIQYSAEINVGFGLWGRACVGKEPMDWWLARFIREHVERTDGLLSVAQKLADRLNEDLRSTGAPWEALRRGIHVAGYVDGLPCAYHVHTGTEGEPQHELRVFKNFPDDLEIGLPAYRRYLKDGMYHLRNGYYAVFGKLFEVMYGYTAELASLGFKWPFASLEHRVSLYRLLIRFVAETLAADGRIPSVGGDIQAIGFNEHGLVIDMQLALTKNPALCGGHAEL